MSSSTSLAAPRPSAKFEFGEAFDALAQSRHPDGRPQIFSAADLEAARAEGHAQGRGEMARETEHLAARTLSAIAADLSRLEQKQGAVLAAINRDSVLLATTIAKKLALGLVQLRPLGEIEIVVRDCLEKIALEPRVVIRVHPTMLEPLKAKLEEIVHESGFEGRAVLVDDPAIRPESCLIDWADGGTERNTEQVAREIDDMVERLLAVGLEPEASGDDEPAAPRGPANP